jgi:hypothetical protein
MTKKFAEEVFRCDVMPGIRNQEYGRPDYALRTEAWNNFTDSLCKDGQITIEQYESWDCPECCYSPSELKQKRSRRVNLVSSIMES